MQPHKMMGFSHYIQALEAERRKIQVFSKELPLSFELLTQAIEACKLQLCGTTTSEHNLNGQSECSGQTTSEGPVLEEFIPIKKRASSDCGEDNEDEQHSHIPKISKDKNNDKRKSDWLRSVQLWNPQPPVKEDAPRKASVLEGKRNGGAFQPFHREACVAQADALTGKAPSSPPPPPPGSTKGVVARSNKKEEKEGQIQSHRKQRRCWSQELHKRFVNALQQLGGADSATPKQIRELMKVDGLTNDEVKSHLQKFRLHTKRPSPMIQNNSNSQTAPFVLVGNIIVQPPGYAAALGPSKASGDVTTLAAPPPVIYAPVASHAPVVPTKGQGRQLEHCFERSNSEERGNHSEVADHCNSPYSSSSTHATPASPGYSI